MLLSMIMLINYKHYAQLDHLLFYKLQIASNLFNSFTQAIKTKVAVQLKFLIATNLAIKKIILVNLTINCKVKTKQCVSIIIQSTVHFTQKSQPNT